MQDARIRFALLIVCLACLLGSGIVLLAGHRAPPPVVLVPSPAIAAPPTTPPAAVAPSAPKPVNRVFVDVSGAVRRPSLYALPPNSRVMQAILAAGGPTAEADIAAVNLAQKVTDGEKVFVPTHRATPSALREDAVPPPVSAAQGAGKQGRSARTAHSGKITTEKITTESGEQVPLNTATAEQLERLPGVGPSLAGRILAYRQQAGGFGKIEDLMQVTGIGPKKYAKIAPFVTLN